MQTTSLSLVSTKMKSPATHGICVPPRLLSHTRPPRSLSIAAITPPLPIAIT